MSSSVSTTNIFTDTVRPQALGHC